MSIEVCTTTDTKLDQDTEDEKRGLTSADNEDDFNDNDNEDDNFEAEAAHAQSLYSGGARTSNGTMQGEKNSIDLRSGSTETASPSRYSSPTSASPRSANP